MYGVLDFDYKRLSILKSKWIVAEYAIEENNRVRMYKLGDNTTKSRK